MRRYSIIIPIYNAEPYLEECLDSIISQSYRAIEVLLIDDGSKDKSNEIARRYASIDSRIRIISKPNGGVSSARNKGLELVTGDFIMFVDSDDYILDNHAIAKIDVHLSQNPGSHIFYKIHYEGNDKKNMSSTTAYLGKSSEQVYRNLITREDMNSTCNKVYDARIIKKYRIRFDNTIRIGEDLLFNINYSVHCKSVSYLDETLYFYRTSNQNSLTSSYIENKYDDLMYVNNELLDWAREIDDSIKNAAYLIRLKNILSCIKDLRHKDCDLTLFAKIRKLAKYIFDNPSVVMRIHNIGYMFAVFTYTYIDARIIMMVIKHHRWS